MRQLLVLMVAGLSLLTGCAPNPEMQDAAQRLRESQGRLAMSEARAQCVMATNLPPGNKIVETCAHGLAPDFYRQIVARDNAQLERDLPAVVPSVTPVPPLEAVSAAVPSPPPPVQPAPAVQPISQPANLSLGPGVPQVGLPFGNRTLVYGTNGGLDVYTPPPAPVPYTGFPSVQPSFDSQPSQPW
jgi:hypothetical protein